MVKDRYQIVHPLDGLMMTMARKSEALREATAYQETSDCQIVVYDVMAQYGRPHLFTHEGFILCWKDRRCECGRT